MLGDGERSGKHDSTDLTDIARIIIMLCSLSGEIAREPVLSTKSGHIFERSLLAKYLDRNPHDPVSQEPMTMADDAIPVKPANEIVRPRPSTNSLPGMISAFQDEWDALMLEVYTLRQSLHSTRKELSHALYRYDAAARVISRLKAERDEARAQLSQVKAGAPVPSGESAMEIEPSEPTSTEGQTLPAEIASILNQNCQDLSSKRRNAFKNPPTTLATKEQIFQYNLADSYALHLTSKPGILCVDAHQSNKNLVATGGIDSRVILFDLESGRVKDTLKGHEKKVNSIAFHKDRLLLASGSDDGTVRLWDSSGKSFKTTNCFEEHNDVVSSVSMHSSGQYLASASHDKTWAFYDINAGKQVHRYEHNSISEGYSCGSFHPDGVLYAGGSGDKIWIWDCVTAQPVKAFEGHSGVITSLSFSENGYYMAASDSNGVAKIWDLRKVAAVYEFPKQTAINSVRFDSTGHYLAVAGESIQVYEVAKQWPQIVSFGDLETPVSDVVFGADASFIASVSMDRHLKVYSTASSNTD